MQDKDFDSLWKRKFTGINHEEPAHDKWGALSNQLDRFESRSRRIKNLIYGSVIGALLLGNFAWWWHGNFSQNLSEPIIIRDTIYTVRFDTLYQTIVIENINTIHPAKEIFNSIEVKSETTPENEKNSLGAEFSENKKENLLVREGKDLENEKGKEIKKNKDILGTLFFEEGSLMDSLVLMEDSVDFLASKVKELEYDHGKEIKKNKDTLGTLFFEEISLIDSIVLIEDSVDFLAPKVKELDEKTEVLKPKFRLQPMWVGGGSLLFFPGRLEGYILTSGIQVEKRIAEKFGFGGSLRFGIGSAESTEIGRIPSSNGNFPVKPGPEFEFVEWDVDFMPFFQYQLYANLEIASFEKITIMAGGGGQWITTLPYSIDYTFVNKDSFREIDQEFEKKLNSRWQGINVFLQAERPIGKRHALGSRISGLIPLEPLQSVLDRQWGADVWLKFKF